MASGGAVLVTGGGGVVGTPLLALLPRESTVCLAHAGPVDCDRVVHGDLVEPRLGLAAADYRALTREVECVIHVAAATRFDTSREEYHAINFEGTRRVLEFAADADARLVHVSTAFVDAERRPPSGLLDPGGYIESKAEAEAAVLASGLDCHVVRPSVVLPEASPPPLPRRQGFHYFIRALINGDMPVLPSDEGTRLDFVSADLVAEVVALVAAAPPPEAISFVTAGEGAWTVREVIAACTSAFTAEGLTVPPPRLVAREMIERLLKPAFYDEMPRRYVRRFEQMDSIATVLLTPRPFASTLDRLAAHYGRPLELDLERTFRVAVGAFLAELERAPA